MNWLTIEEAAARLNNNKISADTLNNYLRDNQQFNLSIEEKFAKVGLFFHKQRWQRNEEAFLQLITKQKLEDKEEPYELSRCTVRVVITLLPSSSTELQEERDCIIAASTHEDLPVAKYLKLSELEPLPQPLVKLLEELEADLANRQFRDRVRKAKSNKQPKKNLPSLPASTQTTTKTINPTNQLKLF
jgi:hypothetical protein